MSRTIERACAASLLRLGVRSISFGHQRLTKESHTRRPSVIRSRRPAAAPNTLRQG